MTDADRAGSPAAHDRHAARMANDRPGNVRRMVAGRKQRPPSDDIGRNRQGGMGRGRVTASCGQRPLQTGDGMPSRLPGAAFACNRQDNLWCESLQKNLGAYACKQKNVCRTGNAAAARAARGANRRVSDTDKPTIVRNFALAKPSARMGDTRQRAANGGMRRCPHGAKHHVIRHDSSILCIKNKNYAPSAHFPLTTGGLTDRYTTSLLGCRSIGRTADSGSANLGSSPSSPANMRSHRLAGLGQRPFTPSTGVQIPLGTPPRHQRGHGSP